MQPLNSRSISLRGGGVAGLMFGALLLSGCSGKVDPFSYVKVNGKVHYKDGTLIPAKVVELTFVSESPPLDPKTTPRPAKSQVNVADGTFNSVTSHYADDGLVPGKHKVLVRTLDELGQPVTGLIAPECGDISKTPLEVDTNQLPMDISVDKAPPPVAKPNAG